VTQALSDEIATGPSTTHWEFYRACREQGIRDVDAIETVVAAFERAVFAPTAVSRETAERALTGAATLIDVSDAESESEPPAGD